MLDKIIFTKPVEQRKINQLEFEMPVGYKIYNPKFVIVSPKAITRVSTGIKVYSEKPATFIFSPGIQSIDFKIVDPIQMIAPKVSTPLTFGVINPIPNGEEWVVAEEQLIAVLQVVQTYQVNLFELSNKMYEQYE